MGGNDPSHVRVCARSLFFKRERRRREGGSVGPQLPSVTMYIFFWSKGGGVVIYGD
jgi:hypothetical protein